VMRHANDIIFVSDENMRFIEANQKAVDTYGWTEDELLRMTIREIRAPEALQDLDISLDSSNPTEGRIFETIHRRKDGTIFPVEISTRKVEIDGQPHRLSIIRDISERKRTDLQLRGSEEKFSKAFQANPAGIAINDLATGRYIEVNESWCRMLRYPPHEVIGRTSVDLGVFASYEDRSRMSKPLLAGESVRNFELQFRTRDGEPRTVLVNAEVIELNGQRCVLSLSDDITDRKRAEAALRASEERYRLIADNTSDLIWLYDQAADRFTYASPAALPLLGYLPEEIVGGKLLDFVAPASADAARRVLDQALRSAVETRAPVHVAVE
jgi:PAS domain S-box-containing protein